MRDGTDIAIGSDKLDLKVQISCEDAKRNLELRESWENEFYGPTSVPKDPWVFDIDDASLIDFRDFLRKKGAHEISSSIHISNRSSFDYLDFDYIAQYSIALNLNVAADQTRSWDAVLKCDDCGNRYIDETFASPVVSKRLRTGALIGLDGVLKLLATKQFHSDYQKAGLSGLTFSWDDSVGRFRVRVEKHIWKQTAGVCATCGMKTNICKAWFFNLKEDYRFDFQFLRMHDDGHKTPPTPVVVSRRAREFFLTLQGTVAKDLSYAIPIVPGLRSDKLSPASGMFQNGETPRFYPLCDDL